MEDCLRLASLLAEDGNQPDGPVEGREAGTGSSSSDHSGTYPRTSSNLHDLAPITGSNARGGEAIVNVVPGCLD